MIEISVPSWMKLRIQESSFNPLSSTLPVKQVQVLTTEQTQKQGLSSQSQGIGFGHIFLIYLKYEVTK